MTNKEKSIVDNIKKLKLDYPMFFWSIIGFVIFSFAIPIIIWLSYLVGHYIIIIPTDISAGELLAYWGAILSFISTSFLGILALWQNIKANNINHRLSLIEKKRFKLDLQPYVLVSKWMLQIVYLKDIIINPKELYIQIGEIDDTAHIVAALRLTFVNTSNTYTIVSYSGAKVYENMATNDNFIEDWSSSTTNQQNDRLYLEVGEKRDMIFYCSLEKMQSFAKKRVCVELILSNRFDEKYKETFEIIFLSLTDANVNGWYVNLNPQRYHIERFDRELNKYVLEYEE